MNKAIKKIGLLDKASKKGTTYTVISIELINGRSSEIFMDAETLALVEEFGRSKAEFDFVSRESKEGKAYDAIELKLVGSADVLGIEEDFTALYFPSKPIIALINLLSKGARKDT